MHMLLDETTPYPNPSSYGYPRNDLDYVLVEINTVNQQIYNQTFVYTKMPTRSYAISGLLQVSLSYNVTNSPSAHFYVWTSVYLGKMPIDGQWTELALLGEEMVGYSTSSYSDYNMMGWFAAIVPNLSINAQERLAIRVITDAYTFSGVTNLTYELIFRMNTSDFLVDIPIIKNP
jgi:hypothetical protein